jgi:hypothetical protein
MPNVKNYFAQPKGTNETDNVYYGTGTHNITGDVISSKLAHTQLVTVTQAEINAGKILIPALTGKQIRVLDIDAKVAGNFATGTSVEIEDSNGTPVVALSYAVAALTDGAFLEADTANVTIGAGYMADLTSDASLNVTKTGSDFTGGTSITLMIAYQYV